MRRAGARRARGRAARGRRRRRGVGRRRASTPTRGRDALRALLADDAARARAGGARAGARGGVLVGALHGADARRAARGRGAGRERAARRAARRGDQARRRRRPRRAHARRRCARSASTPTLVATDAPDPRGYDVAHVFGVFEPATARRQIDAVRAHGAPLVLSPIWLDLRALFATAPHVERALAARSARAVERRLARLHARRAAAAVARQRRAQRRPARWRPSASCVLAADVVLPASEVEAYLYGERLRASRVPFVVAPLGVDDDAFAVERPARARRRAVRGARRAQEEPGRAALRAARRRRRRDARRRRATTRAIWRCAGAGRRRARASSTHAEHAEVLAHDGARAVHAHPSWLESPGLSSLEAAATGARIVVGDRGCEREYFGADVDYADPADPGDDPRRGAARARARPARPRRRARAAARRAHLAALRRGDARGVRARDGRAPLMRILVAAERLGRGRRDGALSRDRAARRSAARGATCARRSRREHRRALPARRHGRRRRSGSMGRRARPHRMRPHGATCERRARALRARRRASRTT